MEIWNKKKILREFYLSQRTKIDPAQKKIYDSAIQKLVLNTAEKLCVKGVLTFISVKNEVDTTALIDELLKRGIRVAVPKCMNDSEMCFFKIKDRNNLQPGLYNIPEPAGDTPVNTDEFKLCIVPALTIDKKGKRLGYGKGYYDNFLINYNGISAGLCYETLLSEVLPAEQFDRSVDLIITELGVKSVAR